MIWFDNLGYQVTTLIAGLGIGGLAVALAAQKTLENIIGGITILASRTVVVGNFCKFGNTLGVVESIGLRSIQLRTLSRTIVDISNALFALDIVENLTLRDKILYRTRLRLSYENSADKIPIVLEKIRDMLEQQKFVEPSTGCIRFLEFAEFSQEFELYVYINTRDFPTYIEHVKEINIAISQLLVSIGVKFSTALAYPVKAN